MRTKILIALGTMVAMLAAQGCSSDVEDGSSAVAIEMTTTIGNDATSRAAQSNLQSTQIASGNSVGVWIVKDTENEETVYENKAYTADGNGNLSTSIIARFPIDETPVRIYAYAPRMESGMGLTSGTFTVPVNQTSDAAYIAGDLLIGAPANNHIDVGVKPKLVFCHKMAKIVVDFSQVTDDAIKGGQITTCSLYNTVEVNVKTGSTIAIGTKTPLTTEIDSDKKAVLLLPEQTVDLGERLFMMTYNGTPIYYVTSAAITLEAGKVYSYNMKIDSVSKQFLLASSTIGVWGIGNGGGGMLEVEE